VATSAIPEFHEGVGVLTWSEHVGEWLSNETLELVRDMGLGVNCVLAGMAAYSILTQSLKMCVAVYPQDGREGYCVTDKVTARDILGGKGPDQVAQFWKKAELDIREMAHLQKVGDAHLLRKNLQPAAEVEKQYALPAGFLKARTAVCLCPDCKGSGKYQPFTGPEESCVKCEGVGVLPAEW
jgi:hypothetical protein